MRRNKCRFGSEYASIIRLPFSQAYEWSVSQIVYSMFGIFSGIVIGYSGRYFHRELGEKTFCRIIGIALALEGLAALLRPIISLVYITDTIKITVLFFYLFSLAAVSSSPKRSEAGTQGGPTVHSLGAFVLGLFLSLLPIIANPVLFPEAKMFHGWLYWTWGVELFVATFVFCIYDAERSWKWAIAIGAGLPSAVLVRGFIDLVFYYDPGSLLVSLLIFLTLTGIFAVVATGPGAVCGYLTKKTYENW